MTANHGNTGIFILSDDQVQEDGEAAAFWRQITGRTARRRKKELIRKL